MIPKFLFCIFTAGFGANLVACATYPCGEIKEGSAELDLSSNVEKASEKSNKNFLPFDFKGYLKNVGPLAKRIFGNKKATSAFSSFLFSGVFAYSVCNYFFKRRPTNIPLKGAETIDASEQVKEDVVTGDGTPNANTPDTTVSDTNTAISNDPESSSDVNKLGNDRDYTVEDNLKESVPYPVLGIIGLTVVVVCLLFYCYSVSGRSEKNEANVRRLNKRDREAGTFAKYGTRENPFYLFDAKNREKEDQNLKHGENGNLDINELFFTESNKQPLVNSNFWKIYKRYSNDFALKLLEKTYFKISPTNLLKILDYDDDTKNKIMEEIIKQKDGNGNISFYVSKLDFKDVPNDKYSCEARLKIVVFKDSFAEGDCLRRHVLADRYENIKLKTLPILREESIDTVLKILQNFKDINEMQKNDDYFPMIDGYNKIETVSFS